MRIKQVSVFVGNETGRLVDMLKPLAQPIYHRLLGIEHYLTRLATGS